MLTQTQSLAAVFVWHDIAKGVGEFEHRITRFVVTTATNGYSMTFNTAY